MDKLEELDKPEDQEIAQDFAEALEPVDASLGTALRHDSYDATGGRPHRTHRFDEIVTRLQGIDVDEHEVVLENLENHSFR